MNVSVEIKTTADVSILVLSKPVYEFESIEMPERTWRRATVDAPDVEGNVEVQSVLDAGFLQISMRVKGSTSAAVTASRATLISAVENRTYRVKITIDGVVQTWTAYRADSITSQERLYLHSFIRPIQLRIPVQPRTVEELTP